jgi:hypothetical protein
VNDLVVVQVLHARCNLLRPVDEPPGRHLVLSIPKKIEKGSVGAVLHDDAVARVQSANTAKLHDIWVVELAELVDVGLMALLDLLHGDQLVPPTADKDDALSSRAEPFLVEDIFERNLPLV